MDNTKELKCTCTHAFQDERYGKGIRVHNPCAKVPGRTERDYRCTVCEDKKKM